MLHLGDTGRVLTPDTRIDVQYAASRQQVAQANDKGMLHDARLSRRLQENRRAEAGKQ